MEIEVQNRSFGQCIVYTDTNIKVEEDISAAIYALKEDGKKDFTKRLGEDIKDEYVAKFVRALDDIIHYREAKFDSSDLVKNLFEKLPEEKQQELLKRFVKDYTEEEV